jgi:hypothetical protein
MRQWKATKSTDPNGPGAYMEKVMGITTTMLGHINKVKECLPNENYPNRPEEARTLGFVFMVKPPQASVGASHAHAGEIVVNYHPGRRPCDLRMFIVQFPKPTQDERRALCRIVVTQVRSLHVHFELVHNALRLESLVFKYANEDDKYPVFARPYIVDWLRTRCATYERPSFRPDVVNWRNDLWSILIIMSEIADWAVLERSPKTDAELLDMKLRRRELISSDDWKGKQSADIFRYGFEFLVRTKFDNNQDNPSRWEMRRFWDYLLDMLE